MTIILFNSLVNGYFNKSNKILNKFHNLISFIKLLNIKFIKIRNITAKNWEKRYDMGVEIRVKFWKASEGRCLKMSKT